MASTESAAPTATTGTASRSVRFKNPPSYPNSEADADGSTSCQYSIADMRAQIIANASVLMPKLNDHTTSDDHLEVVVGKITNPGAPISIEKLRAIQAASLGAHYALLVRRTTKKEIRIVIRGEPRETVADALAWLLEDTEIRIDEMARKFGKDAKGDECTIM